MRRTKSKTNVTCRITPSARTLLLEMSKVLYDRYPAEHRLEGIKEPTMKVAVDYLIDWCFASGGAVGMKYESRQNIWRKIEIRAERS